MSTPQAMFELELPHDATSAGTARRALAAWFGSHLQDRELETATLLTSELVTNAVRHGKGDITFGPRLTTTGC